MQRMQTMTSQPPTNTNAYYDPSANSIWYPKRSAGVVATVVDGADSLAKLKGKRVRGEILEIIDAPVGRGKAFRDDRCEKSKPSGSNDDALHQSHEQQSTLSAPPKQIVSQTALLQKQSSLHQEHTVQTQDLLTRHQQERQNFESMPMQSEKQRERARAEMENRHQTEFLKMQEAHNKEKMEVMQELIAGVTVVEGGQQLELQSEPAPPADDMRTTKRERKSPAPYTKKDSMDSNTNSISKASVVSMPAALASHSNNLDRPTLDAQKSAEIKALMRDKSLDRETRRQKLDDIKAKYSKLIEEAPESNDAAADLAHRRKMELQSIMKDRSLSKEERLKMLAEVKKKYPLEAGHRRATTDAEPKRRSKGIATGVKGEGRAKRRVPVPVENEARKEKSRASKSNPVPEEHPHERGSLGSRPMPDEDESMGTADQSDASTDEQEDFETSTRWNKDGMKVGSALQVAKNLHEEANAQDTHYEDGSTQDDTVSSEEGDNLTELSFSFQSRRRSSHDDDHIDVNLELLKGGGRWNSEPTMSKGSSSGSHQKSVTISEPSSQSTSARSLKIDPLEHAEVNKTPIKTLIRKLEKNDPSMDVLRLDGRGKIKEADWETFFETLESNTTLTHLSVNRCGLTDDLAVGLILALVENSTLTALHLASNKEVTEITGKGVIKVLKESNTTLKQLDLSKTKVKKSTLKDIQTIMDERDEDIQRAKAQKLRDDKVMALLTTTASDFVETPQLGFELDSDDDSNASEDSRDILFRQKSSNSLKKSYVSNKSNKSAASNASSKRSASSRGSNSKNGSMVGSLQSGRRVNGRAGRGINPRAGGALRASVTARQMATMGGDLVSGVGADAKTLREQRKMRGECITCGQKCFEKKLFKKTPLSIPHKVFEGRCLKCNPM